MSGRVELPPRRRNATQKARWHGKSWFVTVGFDRAGRAREVFVSAGPVGSDFRATIEDAAVLMSRMLQAGFGAADIAEMLGREAVVVTAEAASPIGFAADIVARIEAEAGPAMAAAYAAEPPKETRHDD